MKAKEVKNTVDWDFMKPETITVSPNASVGEAIAVMDKFRIHHLLVMQDDNFKGLIEGRDLIFFGTYSQQSLNTKKVSEVMRTKVPMIYESTDVGGVLEMMITHHLTAIPIVGNGRIVGILTETDLLKLFQAILGKGTGLPFLVKEGEAVLANPLVQNVFRLLGNIGL